MKLPLLCCLLFLNLGIVVYGQDYSYFQYTERDGLPSDYIYEMCQDKQGFIWLATENGVSRYDGRHFKTYTTSDGLPDNAILKIYCAPDGKIWVVPFMHYPYYFSNGRFLPIDLPDSMRQKLVNSVNIYSLHNVLSFSVRDEQYFLDAQGVLKPITDLYQNVPRGTHVFELTDTLLVAGNSDSVFLKTGDQFRFLSKSLPNRFIVGVDRNQDPEYVTYKGPGIANPRGSTSNNLLYVNEKDILHFFSIKNKELKFSITSRKPSCAWVDHENTLWVSTLGYGLFHYPSLSFSHISFNTDYPELFSIEMLHNKVVAGDNMSRVFDVKDKKLSRDYSGFLTFSGNMPAQASRLNRIYKMLSYNGSLYVGADAFLLKIDGTGKETIKGIYPVKDLSIKNNQLLVSLGTGALLLDAGDLTVRDTILNYRTTAGIIFDDSYYMGTIGGLVKIDTATKTATPFSAIDKRLSRRVTAIKAGADNSLWVASSGAGVIQLINDKVTRHISTANGLSGDICSSLFIDGKDIWVGTNKGLNKISFINDSVNVTQYTTTDGLSSNIINSVFADDSVVYVAGPSGLSTFSKKYEKEKSLCLLYILQVTARDSVLKSDSLYRFPYKTKNIRFDYAAISYKSSGDIRYYYKLEGLDGKWKTTTSDFVNFEILEPGRYVFMLKAVNKFGVESEIKSIVIIISSPWWKKWWFITVVSLVLAVSVYSVYRRRIYNITKREQRKRSLQAQFAALEQQALLAQMNPHFIFNCLNSIQSFIFRQDVEGANRYIAKFASLIRQTLDNSSRELIPLATEIRYLETYLSLEQNRQEEKFTYSVTTVTDGGVDTFMLPAMLLQPYVENAIRHGIRLRPDNKGMIEIRFETDAAGHLVCTIKDNGVGRARAAELKSKQHIEYMSRGNSITEKRIEMLNLQYNTTIKFSIRDLTGPDGNPEGTLVILTFPPFANPKQIL